MKDLKENRVKNRFFIKGILFILPVFLSCWIIFKIVQFMSSIIPSAIIDKIIYLTSLSDRVPDMVLRTILGFILTVALIYIAGLILSVIGKRFFNKVEKSFFYNIPVFGVIYKTIKQIQSMALYRIFDPVVIQRMQDNEIRFNHGEEKFTLNELFNTITTIIWKELEIKHDVNSFRRTIQKEHLQILTYIMLDKKNQFPNDATALARKNLNKIITKLQFSINNDKLDEYTNSHYIECIHSIESAYEARTTLN